MDPSGNGIDAYGGPSRTLVGGRRRKSRKSRKSRRKGRKSRRR